MGANSVAHSEKVVCYLCEQVHLCEAFHLGRYVRDSGAVSTLSRAARSTVVVVKALQRGADDLAKFVVFHISFLLGSVSPAGNRQPISWSRLPAVLYDWLACDM